MRRYQISDRFTTADLGLELEADSLEELFAAAAEGMMAIIFGERVELEGNSEDFLELSADNLEQLMVDWLSELLYLFDAEGMVGGGFDLKIEEAEGQYRLSANLSMCRYDPVAMPAEHEIKAVTYHRLNIEKRENLYRCHVVFDL